MHEAFLLSRVLLQFSTDDADVHSELSAVVLGPDGSLWTGSDELLTLERLSPIAPHMFGNHQAFPVENFVDLFNDEDEIDIEGMDYTAGYLWFTGSHSTKRKKTKGKLTAKDIERLETLKVEPNRYMLGRIPLVGGDLLASWTDPDNPNRTLRAAHLQKTAEDNILIEALRTDEHLGPFLSFHLPSKENGFDIEGMAVQGNRVFLGFRGPVLRGWAIIIDIEVEEQAPGVLGLKPIGSAGQPYRKHFVWLNGMGIRELCFQGDDLLIMAGPTMDLAGTMQVLRLKDVLDLEEDSISDQDSDNLHPLFHLPFVAENDKAEGMAVVPCLGQPEALLVVYDSPSPARLFAPHIICADVFLLPA